MDEATFEVGYVDVIAKSGKALLVDVEGSEVWVPFSHIDPSSTVGEESEPDDGGELVVSMWLAEREGWV